MFDVVLERLRQGHRTSGFPKELPVLPIYFYVSKNLVSTKVKGWEDNPFNVVYVRNLSLAD